MVSHDLFHTLWAKAEDDLLEKIQRWLQSEKSSLAQIHSVGSQLALSCTIFSHHGIGIEALQEFLTEDITKAYNTSLQSDCLQWVGAICKADLMEGLPAIGESSEGVAKDKWFCSKVGNLSCCSNSVQEIVNLVTTLINDSLSFLEDVEIGEGKIMHLYCSINSSTHSAFLQIYSSVTTSFKVILKEKNLQSSQIPCL